MKQVWLPPCSDGSALSDVLRTHRTRVVAVRTGGGVTGVKSTPHRHTAHRDAGPELVKIISFLHHTSARTEVKLVLTRKVQEGVQTEI